MNNLTCRPMQRPRPHVCRPAASSSSAVGMLGTLTLAGSGMDTEGSGGMPPGKFFCTVLAAPASTRLTCLMSACPGSHFGSLYGWSEQATVFTQTSEWGPKRNMDAICLAFTANTRQMIAWARELRISH